MIHILFPTGGFGTTAEYVIKRFTKELSINKVDIAPDGSMHTYEKERHVWRSNNLISEYLVGANVTTLLYPCVDLSVEQTIQTVKGIINPYDKVIFITIPSIASYERNFIYLYNKINWLEFNDIPYKQWNLNYKSPTDMKTWELREMLSLTHEVWGMPIQTAIHYADSAWAIITTDQLLFDFVNAVKSIINYLGLTLINAEELEQYATNWTANQQFGIEQQQMVDLIVEKIINKEEFEFERLTLVQESLIQFRLMLAGLRLKCYNLNLFPTNTLDFHKHF